MKHAWRLALFLPLLVMMTGCPSNHYDVELTPNGNVIERKLVFYRADGVKTNGTPDYETFPIAQRKSITAWYPANNLNTDGNRYTVFGEFEAHMPNDVGGSGSYKKVTTSLGSSAVYMERFRGDDDLAANAAKRLRGADQFTDLIIGWSRAELGHERGYQRLRKFLDTDFRRDVKNLGMYSYMMRTSLVTRSETPEEFAVRFGQYLVERGYLKMEDLPALFLAFTGDEINSKPLLHRLQRLVASKLGISPDAPSLAFLSDAKQMEESWSKYVMTTDAYRAKFRQWQKEKLLHTAREAEKRVEELYDPSARTNKLPAAPDKPTASDAEEVILKEMQEAMAADFRDMIWRTFDHVTVRLSLPEKPTHTNGKWDVTTKQVVWESDIEQEKECRPVPAFCYASWNTPDEAAQKRHFGRVLLSGDDLSQYCLWRVAMGDKEAKEWDALMDDLQPNGESKKKIDAFRFSSDPPLPKKGNHVAALSDFGKDLILGKLEKPSEVTQK